MISILKNFGTPKIIHASGEGHSGLSHFLSERLGGFGEFLDEVILHAIKETLLLLPFLFLTYLLMEFIEHKAGDKATAFMNKSGKLGPLAGGALGAIPQCGFSSVGSNLFSGKVISMGTLVAVFLATSDEMIPIMIGTQGIGAKAILIILAYKITVAIAVGFAVDGVLHLLKKDGEKIDIDQITITAIAKGVFSTPRFTTRQRSPSLFSRYAPLSISQSSLSEAKILRQ